MSLFAKPLCALFGGHVFRRYGGFLVCDYCGHRVDVRATSGNCRDGPAAPEGGRSSKNTKRR